VRELKLCMVLPIADRLVVLLPELLLQIESSPPSNGAGIGSSGRRDDYDSYTGGHSVMTAGNLQAWRDGACSSWAGGSWRPPKNPES